MLDYFLPADYARCTRKVLTNCRMGKRGITEYIDDFRRLLVCCTDVQERRLNSYLKITWLIGGFPTCCLTIAHP